MEKLQQYEHISRLIRELHGPAKNVMRPHSDDETSSEDRNVNAHSLPILAVDKPQRKRSVFENAFKIPILTISTPTSPESPENIAHKSFSFGHFRRHSHSVRY